MKDKWDRQRELEREIEGKGIDLMLWSLSSSGNTAWVPNGFFFIFTMFNICVLNPSVVITD